MARPRSEEKQFAILQSATEVFAEQGLVASTAAIAKKAGVAEGTLFRYFENKEVLISAVCDYLLDEIEALFVKNLVNVRDNNQRSQIVWNTYIDWALANPSAYLTGNILMASRKLSDKQIEKSTQLGNLFTLDLPLFNGLDMAQTHELFGAFYTVMANAVIDMAARYPHLTDKYKQTGYHAMLRVMEQS